MRAKKENICKEATMMMAESRLEMLRDTRNDNSDDNNFAKYNGCNQ